MSKLVFSVSHLTAAQCRSQVFPRAARGVSLCYLNRSGVLFEEVDRSAESRSLWVSARTRSSSGSHTTTFFTMD